VKGWLIRAQQPRRKRISCKGQVSRAAPPHLSVYAIIVITNILWCMAYKGRVGERSEIAQKSRNSIAVVWVMRMSGGNIKG